MTPGTYKDRPYNEAMEREFTPYTKCKRCYLQHGPVQTTFRPYCERCAWYGCMTYGVFRGWVWATVRDNDVVAYFDCVEHRELPFGPWQNNSVSIVQLGL